MSFAGSIGDMIPASASATMGEGSTNATAPSIERSESWQQDIEHAIIPVMPCPQSRSLAGTARAF